MTALSAFQRLEASGVWREAPQEAVRDVIVSVGDATLILTDPKSDQPLSHWSLPAVTRLNPGQKPAIFAPGVPATDEILEIDDELMISAIEKVHTAIQASRPRPGRLRGGLLVAAAAVLVLGGLAWLPGAAVRHAALIAPPAQREAVGRQVLTQLTETTGAPCSRAAGSAVLDRLARRVTGADSRVVVLPSTLRGARALPGKLIVLGDDLIIGQPAPHAALGHVVAAQLVAEEQDPMAAALTFAGFGAAVSLLTTGLLPDDALDGYGEVLLASAPPRPSDDDALLERLASVGVPSSPYARSLDPSGEAVLTLIEADPFRMAPPEKPVLTEGEWVQLQRICDTAMEP
ncbi:hypothetical protein [uncultured Paracoccus sp.]|uniref:hypothetical protein n=1 Tax=uncultured Paracoccus sp. TaxID=189685 RepID=UPI0026046362|nr:hypothetical protein [uncultured Paracoccus sp.]